MTVVIYDDKHLALSVEGHAGYAEEGKDIVCSSVSILSLTLASFVERMQDEGVVKEAKTDISKGNVYIEATPITTCFTRCKIVFDAICDGFRLLAEHYPDNVQYISRNDLI